MPNPEVEKERGIRRFWELVGAIPAKIPGDQLASPQNEGLRPGKLRTFLIAIGAIPKEANEIKFSPQGRNRDATPFKTR